MIEQQSVDSEGLRFDSLWELTFSSLTHTCDKTKNIFLHFFTELKTDRLFYSIYKLDTIDIADPSSMLEACHMNFVIDLAHHRVSVAQWYRNGAQNLKVWGSIPHGYSGFFLFPTLMTRQKTSFSTSLTSSKLTISLILFTVLIHVKYLILSPMQSLHKSSMVNRSVSRYHHHSKPTVKEWNCNSPKKTFSWSLKHYTPHLGGRSFIVMTLYSF